jgi:hypothetical protein
MKPRVGDVVVVKVNDQYVREIGLSIGDKGIILECIQKFSGTGLYITLFPDGTVAELFYSEIELVG